MVTVSVHIVTYNSASVISRCLLQLRRQTFKNTRILVVDNASTDNTVSIVKQMGIQVIENKTNVGYAKAHNQAIRATKSTYILTLNPDVFLDKHFLEYMVHEIERSPDHVGSTCGLLLRVNTTSMKSTIVDGAGLYLDSKRRQRLRYEGQDRSLVDSKNTFIFGPDGSAALYKRTMLQDISIRGECFDNSFFMHKEDVDVVWRAQLYGWTSMFIPSAVGYHIRSFRAGNRKGVDNTLKKLAVRNRYLLLIKNETFYHFITHFFQIFLYDLGIFLYIFFFERSSLPAYQEVVHLFPILFKKRLRIMKTHNQRTTI